jgi:hypothetical protein
VVFVNAPDDEEHLVVVYVVYIGYHCINGALEYLLGVVFLEVRGEEDGLRDFESCLWV